MSVETHQLADEQATLALGEALAPRLAGGATVYLQGDLGAGKTTLVRGMLRGFGHGGAVKSPTYTIVEPYDIEGVLIYHFDLYRLSEPEELEMIGVRDYFTPNAVCLFEWPQYGRGFIPHADVTVNLTVSGTGRVATLTWTNPAEKNEQ